MNIEDLVSDLYTPLNDTYTSNTVVYEDLDPDKNVDKYKDFRNKLLEKWSNPDNFNLTSGSIDTDGSSISSGTYTTDNTGARWGVNQPVFTTGGWTTGGHTITTGSGTTYTDYIWPVDRYPAEEDELGLVYIEGDEIKLKTPAGKVVTVGRLDDSEDFLPLEVIAAKKKLLEESKNNNE